MYKIQIIWQFFFLICIRGPASKNACLLLRDAFAFCFMYQMSYCPNNILTNDIMSVMIVIFCDNVGLQHCHMI